MKKFSLLVVATLLVGAVASAGRYTPHNHSPRYRLGAHYRLPPSGGDNGLIYNLLGPAGVGMPAAQELCASLQAGDKSGNWYCLNGDGTMASGSVLTLSPQNSPTVQSHALCPNGANCTAVNRNKLLRASSQHFATSATTVPTGSFSIVVLYSDDPTNASGEIASKWDLGTLTYTMEAAAGGVRFYVNNGTSQVNTINTSDRALYEERFYCARYDTADGRARLRVNGVNDTASGALSPATPRSNSMALTVGAASGGGAGVNGRIRGLFFTEKALSEADCDRIQALVVPRTITSAAGGAVTFSRNSIQTCCQNYGDTTGCTVLSAGVPCISGFGGVLTERALTQILLRTYQLDNAAWADVGTPTVTANAYEGPFGWPDMEKLEDDDGAALEGREQVVATTSQNRVVMTAWLRSDTATEATMSITGTGNSGGDVTCAITGLTSTPTRYACISTAAYAAGITAITARVLVGDAVGDTGSIGAGHVNVMMDTLGVQSRPTSYVPATSASVNRVLAHAEFATPAALTDTAGCAAVSWRLQTLNTTNQISGIALYSGGPRWSYFSNATNARGLDQTTTLEIGVGTVYNNLVRTGYSWGVPGTKLQNLLAGTSVVGAYDGTARSGTTAIGSESGVTNYIDGYVGNIQLYSIYGGCQ